MKYCRKCGAQMKDESEFCPKCGCLQNGTDIETENRTSQENDVPVARKAKTGNKLLYIGIIAFAVIAMMGGYFYHKNMQAAENAAAAKQEESVENTEDAQTEEKSEETESKTQTASASKYEEVQRELNERGVAGKVLASTKGNNEAGYLSLVQDGSNNRVVIYDKKNNRIALVVDNKDTKTGSTGKTGTDEVIIFDMIVPNDAHDKDEKSGIWDGSKHIMPVYASYKVDAAGNVTPGMLTTGRGRNPSHYQEYFYEPRNVDTINLFLTEMALLFQIAKEKGVDFAI